MRYFIFFGLFFIANACYAQDLEQGEGLLSTQGSNESVSNDQLIQLATQNNDSLLIDIVMKYGHPLCPTLNMAMQSKDDLAVKILIEYGADINSRSSEKGKTVLETAIEFDRIDLIEYFLLKGANPISRKKWTEIFTSKKSKIFPNPSAYKIEYETTAMYDAIKAERLDILVLFDQYGADLNAICYYEFNNNSKIQVYLNPIQIALKFKQKNIVAFLLSKGVNL